MMLNHGNKKSSSSPVTLIAHASPIHKTIAEMKIMIAVSPLGSIRRGLAIHATILVKRRPRRLKSNFRLKAFLLSISCNVSNVATPFTVLFDQFQGFVLNAN